MRREASPEPRATLLRLAALAWPIVVSRSTQVVVGLCDAAMVAPLQARGSRAQVRSPTEPSAGTRDEHRRKATPPPSL